MFEINGKKVKDTDVNKFWSRVDIKGPDDCWEWRGWRNSSKKGYNYGYFWLSGIKGFLAHRLALSFFLGKWVVSNEVRHTCDNPSCCNPNHLLEGTHLENMQDKASRGRVVITKGTDHPLAKLNDEKVKEIRQKMELYQKRRTKLKIYLDKFKKLKAKIQKLKKKLSISSIKRISEEYQVDKTLIKRIYERTSWAHVKDD